MASDTTPKGNEMAKRTDLKTYGRNELDAALIEGAFVTGRNIKYGTVWGGIYRGIRPSEWTGEPVYFFEDGYIGETPQRNFTIVLESVVI